MSQTGVVPKTFAAFVARLVEENVYVEVAQCASDYHMPLESLWSRSRHAKVVGARHAAFLFLRSKGWSFPRIGALFDRDHTSVLTACQQSGHAQATTALGRRGQFRVA